MRRETEINHLVKSYLKSYTRCSFLGTCSMCNILSSHLQDQIQFLQCNNEVGK